MTNPTDPADPWATPAESPAPAPANDAPSPVPYAAPEYGQQPPQAPPPSYGQPPPYAAPPPYGQPPYGQPPYGHGGYAYAPPRSTNGFAIASMVLGILWIYWIGSILALIFGYVARNQIRAGNQQGDGMAIAGIVLGWIGVGILLLLIVFGVAAGSGAFA